MRTDRPLSSSAPGGSLTVECAAVPLGLYIHIPFCRSKCGYCDFSSFAGLGRLVPEYVDALCREMQLRSEGSPRVCTIYFGGGTPSLLTSDQIARLLKACHDYFHVDANAEISMEANPGTVSAQWLSKVRELGVSRLSIGFQSLNDGELRFLERIHSASQAVDAYEMARRAGFRNLNIDLIYGLPGQTLAQWRETLDRALHLAPEHFSLYPLMLEEDTPLGRLVDAGTIPAPDPDAAAEMYGFAEAVLASAGYEHYELSNWARPGFCCCHNLAYWENRPYLGVGAGAHSSFGGHRLANLNSPWDYISSLQAGGLPVNMREPIDQAMELSETIILGLRLGVGVDLDALRGRFGLDVAALYRPEIDETGRLGLLEQDGRILRLTARGRLLGNEVFWRFLPKGDAGVT